MSKCGNCPTVGGWRLICCGETRDEAAARLGITLDELNTREHRALDPAFPLGNYRPASSDGGTYNCICHACRVVFEADKGCIECHACAMKQAGVTPRETLDTAKQRPRVGHRVRIAQKDGTHRVGVVCQPNDPRRAGTYTSTAHGDIPIRFELGNRKDRRKTEALSRKRAKGSGR